MTVVKIDSLADRLAGARVNQGQLGLAAQPANRGLTPLRGGAIGLRLEPDQAHRPACPAPSRTPTTMVVLMQSPLGVGGHPGVERLVAASDDVDVPGHPPILGYDDGSKPMKPFAGDCRSRPVRADRADQARSAARTNGSGGVSAQDQ